MSIWKEDKKLIKMFKDFFIYSDLYNYRVIKDYIQKKYSLILTKVNKVVVDTEKGYFCVFIFYFNKKEWKIYLTIYKKDNKWKSEMICKEVTI